MRTIDKGKGESNLCVNSVLILRDIMRLGILNTYEIKSNLPVAFEVITKTDHYLQQMLPACSAEKEKELLAPVDIIRGSEYIVFKPIGLKNPVVHHRWTSFVNERGDLELSVYFLLRKCQCYEEPEQLCSGHQTALANHKLWDG